MDTQNALNSLNKKNCAFKHQNIVASMCNILVRTEEYLFSEGTIVVVHGAFFCVFFSQIFKNA